MSDSILDWNGDEVLKIVLASIDPSINSVLENAARDAMVLVHVDKGDLRDSIDVVMASQDGDGVMGEFGSYGIDYAFWQEVLPEPKGKPYLRPAADQNFDALSSEIANRLK